MFFHKLDDSIILKNGKRFFLKGFDFNPVDTGRKLNVHKTFRRRPIRLFERFQYFSFETKIQKNAGSFFLKKTGIPFFS